MRKAIDGLVSEGLLVRRQGSGTFVRGRVEKNFSMLTSFSEDMRARGRNAAQRLAQALERDRHARGGADAALEPGHAGVSLSSPAIRGRRADGARIRDDRRRLPAFARRRRRPRSTRRSSARATGRCARCSVCARCCSRASRPSCCARSRATRACWSSGSGFLQDGRAVEFSQSYYRGDTYDFVAELSTP